PFAELLQKVACPVGIINFKTVAEDCVGRTGTEGLKQPVADAAEVVLDGSAIVVIHHEPLGPEGWTLDLHSRPAGYEEEDLIRALNAIRKPNGPTAGFIDWRQGVFVDGLPLNAR